MEMKNNTGLLKPCFCFSKIKMNVLWTCIYKRCYVYTQCFLSKTLLGTINFNNSNNNNKVIIIIIIIINPLTPNDHYNGRTAPLTSKRCILYIYSTNTGTEYFKHGIFFRFFSLKMQFVS